MNRYSSNPAINNQLTGKEDFRGKILKPEYIKNLKKFCD